MFIKNFLRFLICFSLINGMSFMKNVTEDINKQANNNNNNEVLKNIALKNNSILHSEMFSRHDELKNESGTYEILII